MTTRTFTTAAAGAALGLVLVGVPVLASAQAAPSSSAGATCTACRSTDGNGNGNRNGGMAQGRDMTMAGRSTGAVMGQGAQAGRHGSRGVPSTATTTATTTLTTAQRQTLVAMVEEEKLAHDVYVALADRYPSVTQFARIATSESQHQAALRTLLSRYGITDPTAGLAAAEFPTSAVSDLYASLLAQATSADAALQVGVTIETMDIADLTTAMSGLPSGDVLTVYSHLRSASQHHLAAFGG